MASLALLGKASAVVVSLVLFVLLQVLSIPGVAENLGLWQNSTGEISQKYQVEITPSTWTFIVWGFIYLYQLIWLIYGVTTLFRSSKDGRLFYSPPYMPTGLYISYSINMVFNASWLATWNNDHIVLALAVFLLMVVTLYICLYLSFRALDKYEQELISQDKGLEIRLVRGLVQNGLAMYATWVTIAILVNFAATIVYRDSVSQATAGTLCLVVLTIEYLGWLILDVVYLDRYTRYLFTPYFVTTWALTGILSKNWSIEGPNGTITLVLLVVSVFGAIIKGIAVFRRSKENPVPVASKQPFKGIQSS